MQLLSLNNKTIRLLSIIYLLLTVADILSIQFGYYDITFWVKPMLMPVLILMILQSKTLALGKWLLINGLFFSFLGDVFLLYEFKNALFFIFGLAAFLITHICYIIYFLQIKSQQVSLLKIKPWLIVLIAAYGIGLVTILYSSLDDLKIPVMVYALVICVMLVCSLHVFYKTGRPANVCFVMGALLFVMSDSLLAINKFLLPFQLAGLFVMLTYCTAQYLIVSGHLKRH